MSVLGHYSKIKWYVLDHLILNPLLPFPKKNFELRCIRLPLRNDFSWKFLKITKSLKAVFLLSPVILKFLNFSFLRSVTGTCSILRIHSWKLSLAKKMSRVNYQKMLRAVNLPFFNLSQATSKMARVEIKKSDIVSASSSV